MVEEQMNECQKEPDQYKSPSKKREEHGGGGTMLWTLLFLGMKMVGELENTEGHISL